MNMYFETYDEALAAAIKQSIGKLVDTKLYVKYDLHGPFEGNSLTGGYKIGFTPDATTDAYVYNGEVKLGKTT